MKLVFILVNESLNCDNGIGDEAVIADEIIVGKYSAHSLDYLHTFAMSTKMHTLVFY